MNFDYYIPTRILFGAGRLNDLHKQKLPGKKALIVISNGKSTRANGYLARVEKELELAGAAHVVFDKVQPNPTKDNVMEGAALARAEACDFVLGLGGGSPIDAAKAIAVMAANPGDYWDYIAAGSGKGQPLANSPLPVVAVTTTAGTGTEADPWTVITKEDSNEKIGAGWPEVFPVLSIVDPELMMTVPPHLTAYQGFDALFHSTEGYLANCSTPISDIYAIKAIELIGLQSGQSSQRRFRPGSARRRGAAQYPVGHGRVDFLLHFRTQPGHALSAWHPNLPHGAGLIMISRAYYQTFVDKHACDERMVAMAKALGRKDADKAEDFVAALVDLQKACGVDDLKMSDYGIDGGNLRRYAQTARETMGGLFALDPAPLDENECVEILRQSYK